MKLKRNFKIIASALAVLSVAGYWYHHNKSCSLVTVHIIRHGVTDANQQGILYGSVDVPLNPIGRQQAEAMAHKLAVLHIADLYSSPQQRAHETALILGAQLQVPVIVDERLKERNFGKAEGIRTHQLEQFIQDNPDHAIEPLEVHVARITDFLNDMAVQHKTEVYVVGHSGMVKSLFDYLNIAPEAKIQVPNCSLFTFVYDPCSGRITYRNYQENLDR